MNDPGWIAFIAVMGVVFGLYRLEVALAKQTEILGRIEGLLYRQNHPVHDDN